MTVEISVSYSGLLRIEVDRDDLLGLNNSKARA